MTSPPRGKLAPERLYRAYAAVLSATHRYAAARSIAPCLAATSAPRAEFARIEPFALAGDWGVLPQSSSFHKQLAAAHLGSVYCVSAAYRRGESGDAHREVFHQLEFEFAGATLDDATETIFDILQVLETAVRRAIGAEHRDSTFSAHDEIDLSTMAHPLDAETYDAWVREVVGELRRPLLVLHTPQTPPPFLNKTRGRDSLGFDVLAPLPAGEVASGGEREPGAAAAFLRQASEAQSAAFRSSGFGIGLERLVMAFLDEQSIDDVRYPGSGPWD